MSDEDKIQRDVERSISKLRVFVFFG